MGKQRINDGLTKSERYRLKDLDAYRQLKREYAKTPEQRAKRTAYMREWRAIEENREKNSFYAKRWREENLQRFRTASRARYFLKTHGMTVEDRDRLVAKQGGKCAICRKAFASNRTTHVDHCHNGGGMRGILCFACNTRLGWYERFRKTIDAYLRRRIRAGTTAARSRLRAEQEGRLYWA
jgi:hypothetical protein